MIVVVVEVLDFFFPFLPGRSGWTSRKVPWALIISKRPLLLVQTLLLQRRWVYVSRRSYLLANWICKCEQTKPLKIFSSQWSSPVGDSSQRVPGTNMSSAYRHMAELWLILAVWTNIWRVDANIESMTQSRERVMKRLPGGATQLTCYDSLLCFWTLSTVKQCKLISRGQRSPMLNSERVGC